MEHLNRSTKEDYMKLDKENREEYVIRKEKTKYP